MSYAQVAASGPRQSSQEAAAPQPPEVVPNESASTSSLIDVDMPSVQTVHSDFLDQDIKTTTQAERRDREAESSSLKKKASAGANSSSNNSSSSSSKASSGSMRSRADAWLTGHFADLSDGSAGALAVANLAAVVGLSSYLGYRAWALYDRGALDWKAAGVGVGILAAVGAVESVVGGFLYRGKANKGSS